MNVLEYMQREGCVVTQEAERRVPLSFSRSMCPFYQAVVIRGWDSTLAA